MNRKEIETLTENERYLLDTIDNLVEEIFDINNDNVGNLYWLNGIMFDINEKFNKKIFGMIDNDIDDVKEFCQDNGNEYIDYDKKMIELFGKEV